MTSFGLARRGSAAAVAFGLFASATLGQPVPQRPADPIELTRARQNIADQKATADTRNAIENADQLARTNPARAAQALRAAQLNIDTSAAISGDARKTLTTLLQAKLAAVEGKPAVGAGMKADPNGAAAKAGRKAVFDAMVAEVKEVNEGVDYVKRLHDLGRTADADRAVAALATKYPNNPAVIGLTQKDNVAKAIAESRTISQMQADRFRISQNNLIASATPAIADIEYPKNWKELSRQRLQGVKLTAKEEALLKALDAPVTVSFNNQALDYVLQELANVMNQPLLIDARSLSDLGIDMKKPVSVDAKGLSARTVLRQVLGGQGLTFVVKGEAIQVMTVEKARETLVTRAYYLADIVQARGPFGGGAAVWGPAIDYEQTMANVKVVVDAIQSSVDPLSWKEKNGPCSITFHYPSMSLIVRASSEVHATLGSQLGAGR